VTNEQAQVIREVARASLAGEIAFPQVVGSLTSVGVEGYHADCSRQETTYYLPDGDSLVVPVLHEPHATAIEFSASAVEAAVRQSQRGEHTYVDFMRKTMAAGCIGYFVQITGRRAIYFGRSGDFHIEHFPPT
jgi:uncharacterized protein YbcV (DUF1398 family)